MVTVAGRCLEDFGIRHHACNEPKGGGQTARGRQKTAGNFFAALSVCPLHHADKNDTALK